jgi:hypothetical protein
MYTSFECPSSINDEKSPMKVTHYQQLVVVQPLHHFSISIQVHCEDAYFPAEKTFTSISRALWERGVNGCCTVNTEKNMMQTSFLTPLFEGDGKYSLYTSKNDEKDGRPLTLTDKEGQIKLTAPG